VLLLLLFLRSSSLAAPVICCNSLCPACILPNTTSTVSHTAIRVINDGCRAVGTQRCPCANCLCCYTHTLLVPTTTTCTEILTEEFISTDTLTLTSFAGSMVTEFFEITFTARDTIIYSISTILTDTTNMTVTTTETATETTFTSSTYYQITSTVVDSTTETTTTETETETEISTSTVIP